MIEANPSSAEFFEAKYQAAPDSDPWKFATAAYELRRYNAVMRALSDRRYERAFEPGCSIGVLTEQLAELCDEVCARDFSPTAVEAAKMRCKYLPNVMVQCEALTADGPWGRYDLIVLCEIGYYFTSGDWKILVRRMVNDMRPGAVLLACHWLGESIDHIQSGDAVHVTLDHPKLQRTLHEVHDEFRLERWTHLL